MSDDEDGVRAGLVRVDPLTAAGIMRRKDIVGLAGITSPMPRYGFQTSRMRDTFCRVRCRPVAGQRHYTWRRSRVGGATGSVALRCHALPVVFV